MVGAHYNLKHSIDGAAEGASRGGRPTKPAGKVSGLAGDGFGEMGVARGDAVLEEAARGKKLGVEKSGTGGAAD